MGQSKDQFMNNREEEVQESAHINGQIQKVNKSGKPLSMVIAEQQQEIEKLENYNKKLWQDISDIKCQHDMEVSAKRSLFEKLQKARTEIDELTLKLKNIDQGDGHDEIAQENDWDKTHNKK